MKLSVYAYVRFLRNVACQKVLESANVLRSYSKNNSGTVFIRRTNGGAYDMSSVCLSVVCNGCIKEKIYTTNRPCVINAGMQNLGNAAASGTFQFWDK